MFAAIATLAMTAFSGKVNAATFVVNTTADTQDASPGNGACADSGGQCSLRAAITEANAFAGADIITLPAGTYTISLAGANENANAGGDFDITTPLTINGAGAATTIVQAAATPNTATERVFHIASNNATAVTIDGVTIQNGVATAAADGQGRGGGIKVAGDGAADGTGINFTLTNSTVQNNRADTRGGGLAVNKGNMTVTGCTFTGNIAGQSSTAGGAGGAVIVDAQDNTAVPAQTVTFTNTTMSDNRAETALTNSFGGAVIVRAVESTVTFDNCNITNNMSNATTSPSFRGFAGGLYNQNAHMIVQNSTVSGNTSSDYHSGIRVLASPIVAGTDTVLDIVNSTISNNSSPLETAQGGGIANIAGATFSATVNIDKSTISNNTLAGTASLGGGILSYNTAAGGATINMTNSTVSNNSAADAGGIYTDGAAATLVMDYCTVDSNHATSPTGDGGGVYQDNTAGGSTFISDTVISNNTAAGGTPDIAGVISSLGYNHIENTTCSGAVGCTFAPSTGDVTGSDPQLGPLANNGGPTQTHLPASTSPLLNTIPNGTNGCGNPVNTDQRGQPRPFPAGGMCDKGSVERGEGGGPSPTPTPSPATPTPTPITPTPTPSPATPTPTPATPTPTPATPTPSPSPSHVQHFLDFNGDGRTDYALTRAANGLKTWYVALNGLPQFLAPQWGIATDREIPADYDGDNKADFAVFRDTADPARAHFYILRSLDATVQIEQFGRQGDDPKIVGDYDHDGKADVAVFRNGVSEPCGAGHPVFFWRPSGTPGVDFRYDCWGIDTDAPYVGDFDGDGTMDRGVIRRPGGQNTVYIRRSSDQGIEGIPFGITGDTYIPCDYDGDGKNDLCLVRLVGSEAQIYILTRTGGGTGASPIIFSNIVPETVDQLAFGDFDGDGTTDFGTFHAPSGGNGLFIIRTTADGGYIYYPWGLPGDHSVAEEFTGGSGN